MGAAETEADFGSEALWPKNNQTAKPVANTPNTTATQRQDLSGGESKPSSNPGSAAA